MKLTGYAWVLEGDEDLGWIRMNFEAAAEGLKKRGHEVKRISSDSEVDLREGDVLHGTVGFIQQTLDDPPRSPDYPTELRPFLRRDIRKTTLGEVRHEETGLFVKPLQHKAFTGLPVREETDWISTKSFDDDLPVYVSDLIEIDSEWRVYVNDSHRIEEICHYRGDPLSFPEPDIIEEMVSACGIEHPYALDVAVDSCLVTCLVEVNDMATAGNYGIDPIPYASLIEQRWQHYWAKV